MRAFFWAVDYAQFINSIIINRKSGVSTVFKCVFEQRINDYSYIGRGTHH